MSYIHTFKTLNPYTHSKPAKWELVNLLTQKLTEVEKRRASIVLSFKSEPEWVRLGLAVERLRIARVKAIAGLIKPPSHWHHF